MKQMYNAGYLNRSNKFHTYITIKLVTYRKEGPSEGREATSMKKYQQWATTTQAIHSELISIHSNITTLTKITIPFNWCVISLSANATTPAPPVRDKAFNQNKMYIKFFAWYTPLLLAYLLIYV
jgi:hypothetical protein